MKKIAYDTMKLDSVQIVKDNEYRLTVNAVISQEGVYDYPEEDGTLKKALKCRRELGKMARRLRYAGAKLILHDHPDSMVIMSQQQVHGGVQKMFLDNGKVRAQLTFDKEFVSKEFIKKVHMAASKISKALDVSIGFYYQPEWKAGVWTNPLTGERIPYDYIMRDMLLDHVASGVWKGRCPAPACGIGVDTALRRYTVGIDKVVKRGNQWCIEHTHGEKAGTLVKGSCHSDKSKTEAMHRAIEANKHSSSVSNKKGGKKVMTEPIEEEEVLKDLSEQEVRYPTRSKAFNECVSVRVSEGMTRGEAEAHCEAATLPSDEPTPPPGLDQDELSPYQKCIKEEIEAGKNTEEAIEACKAKGIVKGDQDAAFENCVTRKKEEGMTQEEAEKECRAEHPVAAEDQEVEKTPMERCVAEQVDAGKTEEEARTWCEAELAGEHEQATDLIERSQKLLRMKEQRDIERQRNARRHPV